jgi:hypothetical protein
MKMAVMQGVVRMVIYRVYTPLTHDLLGFIKINFDWETPFFFESLRSGRVIFAKSLLELQDLIACRVFVKLEKVGE